MPNEIESDSSLGGKTRFEFPFNSAKKSASDAFSEIRTGLEEISEATLLFLSDIEAIHWRVEGGTEMYLLRVPHSDHHIETLKVSRHGKATESSHFLRFTQPVEEQERQYTAIAFELQALPNVSTFDSIKPLSEQFRLVPAAPGRVAVFFTAVKETSGLRFHLHAPFAPELSRASIKDTTENELRFQLLAVLLEPSLFAIRDLGFLNRDFLDVLPNPHDNLPDRYACIRETIVKAMNEQPLTPTHAGTHAPARQLLQARASLKTLLAKEDIEVLVDYEETPSAWAVGATQKNSDIDYFLSGLAIEEWDVEQFVKVLEKRLSNKSRLEWVDSQLERIDGPDAALLEWLGSKPDEWHQKLYALLYRELEDELWRLRNLCIVRLSTGKYRVGSECYFPTEDTQEDSVLPRVAMGTYTSGRSKAEKERARKLLEAIGVREVGEREQVEAILKQRYSKEAEIPDRKTHKNDLIRFISLVENDPKAACLFKDYRIFERADDQWGQPDQVYLDVPYLETGLHAYYRLFGDEAERAALADGYVELGFSCNELAKFARSTGASTQLEVSKVSCLNNPEWSYLKDVPGVRYTSSKDSDYLIPELDRLLGSPTVEISSLIWETVCNFPKDSDYLKATYRKNWANGSRCAESQLVHQLRQACWVSQGPQSHISFVRPAEASRDLLPEGFPFDPGWPWIKAIRFGEESAKKVEEDRTKREAAKELGFDDAEALDDGKWFGGLDPEERERIKSEHESKRMTDLPDHESSDRERRAEGVRKGAKDAPGRDTETRNRSVSKHQEAVKEQAKPYLRIQYTNGDKVMICQVCKNGLPFKLADEDYYFEAVEFLPELEKHHYQNYLALCPNHAAMYRHANDSAERMKDLFLELNESELDLDVVLVRKNRTVYFTKTHIADLRTIIAVEDSS